MQREGSCSCAMSREGSSSRTVHCEKSWAGSPRTMPRTMSGHASFRQSSSGSPAARPASSTSFRASRLFSFSLGSSRANVSDDLLFMGDNAELNIDWDRFKADEQAVQSLSKLLSTYNEKRLEAARAGAAVTEAMLEYFPPERANTRDAAATLHETHLGFVLDAEAAEAVNGQVLAGPVDGSFEDAVLAPVRAVEEKLDGVREMARVRNDMVSEIRRYESKVESASAADSTTAKLTEAITRYCLVEKDIGEQCAEVHDNFERLLDPVLEGFIRHESQMHSYGLAQLRQAQLDLEDVVYDPGFDQDLNSKGPVQRPTEHAVQVGKVTFPSERPSPKIGSRQSSLNSGGFAPRQGSAKPLLSPAIRPSNLPPVVAGFASSSEDEDSDESEEEAVATTAATGGRMKGTDLQSVEPESVEESEEQSSSLPWVGSAAAAASVEQGDAVDEEEDGIVSMAGKTESGARQAGASIAAPAMSEEEPTENNLPLTVERMNSMQVGDVVLDEATSPRFDDAGSDKSSEKVAETAGSKALQSTIGFGESPVTPMLPD